MSKALELAKFGRETPPTGVVVGDSDAQTLSSKTFSDSPVFSSGTANGIPYLNGSKVFTTGSALVFDGTNLGVGTASPAAKLHVSVAGDNETTIARFGTTSSGNVTSQLKVLSDPTASIVKIDATGAVANNIQFLTGGTFRAQLSNSGYFSLGTASATEVLTVSNSNYESLGLYRNVDYNVVGANGVRMYFGGYVGSTATRTATIDATMMTATTSRLAFYNLVSGTLTEQVRIDTNGSIRIGGNLAAISATSEKLTLDGGTSQAATMANTSDSSGTVYLKNRSNTANTIQPYLYLNDADGGNRAGFGVKYTDASLHQFAQGGINWYTGSAGFSNLRATITSAGNISFGSTGTADRPVHLIGTGTRQYFKAETTTNSISNEAGFEVKTPNSNFLIGSHGSTNALWVYDMNAAAERLRIDSAGLLILGNNITNTGGGRLDLISNSTSTIQARSSSIGSGDGTADVTVTRAVSSLANWWANARYDAYSHTWGYGASATAGIAMRITGAGNLALGTTGNTAQKLNVNGALWLLGNDDANYSTLISARYDSSNSFTMQTRLNSGTMSEFLALYSDGGGGNPRLALAPNGWKVGIGTTDAKNPLHVVDSRTYTHSTTADHTTNMSGIRVTNTNNGDNWAGVWFGLGSAQGTHWSGIAGARTNSAVNWGTHLSFFTHEDTTSNLTQTTERMRIDSKGVISQTNVNNWYGFRTRLYRYSFSGSGSSSMVTYNIGTLVNYDTTYGTATVKIRTPLVYATAGSNLGYWEGQATIRRSNNGTSWTVLNSTIHSVDGTNGVSDPVVYWSGDTCYLDAPVYVGFNAEIEVIVWAGEFTANNY